MKSIVQNFINGNLKDAKEGAEKYSVSQLYRAFQDAGFSKRKALKTAYYLKGNATSQEACDAE